MEFGKGTGPRLQTDSDHFQVANFLGSIKAECDVHYGSSSLSELKAEGKPLSTSPQLPISATVSLIDAQIDSLQGQIVKAISDNKEAFRSQSVAAKTVDSDLNRLWDTVVDTASHLDDLPQNVFPAAQAYHHVLAETSAQAAVIDALSSLVPALRDLETAESLLIQHEIVALDVHLASLQASVSALDAFDYLAQSSAVIQVKTRANTVKTSLCDMVSAAWHTSVSVVLHHGSSDGKKLLQAQVKLNPTFSASQSCSKTLSLADLGLILSRHGLLERLVQQFAQEILEKVVQQVLFASPLVSLIVETDATPVWLVSHKPEGLHSPARAISSLFTFIETNFFKPMADQCRLQQQQVFSRILLPKLIPMVLDNLTARLPSTLLSGNKTIEAIQTQSQDAVDLANALRQHGYAALTRAPDEGEDKRDNVFALQRWATQSGLHFSRALSIRALEAARAMILSRSASSVSGQYTDVVGGWESETIEVESKLASEQTANLTVFNGSSVELDNPSPSIGSKSPSTSSLQAPATTSESTEAGWNDFGSPWTETNQGAKGSVRQGHHPAAYSGMSRSDSQSDSSSAYAPTAKASTVKKGKPKLGGVRVIRPQDQLGSGPFHANEGLVDDTSWGLDEDEDASIPASSSGPSGRLQKFAPQVSMDLENDHDAWFTQEAVEETPSIAQSPPTVPIRNEASTIEANQSGSSSVGSLTHHTAFAVQVNDFEEDEDDAWGLTEEQLAERRASMLLFPSNWKLALEATRVVDLAEEKEFQADKGSADDLDRTQYAAQVEKDDADPPNEFTVDPVQAATFVSVEEAEDGWTFDDHEEMTAPAPHSKMADAVEMASKSPYTEISVAAQLPTDEVPTSQPPPSLPHPSSIIKPSQDEAEDGWGFEHIEEPGEVRDTTTTAGSFVPSEPEMIADQAAHSFLGDESAEPNGTETTTATVPVSVSVSATAASSHEAPEARPTADESSFSTSTSTSPANDTLGSFVAVESQAPDSVGDEAGWGFGDEEELNLATEPPPTSSALIRASSPPAESIVSQPTTTEGRISPVESSESPVNPINEMEAPEGKTEVGWGFDDGNEDDEPVGEALATRALHTHGNPGVTVSQQAPPSLMPYDISDQPTESQADASASEGEQAIHAQQQDHKGSSDAFPSAATIAIAVEPPSGSEWGWENEANQGGHNVGRMSRPSSDLGRPVPSIATGSAPTIQTRTGSRSPLATASPISTPSLLPSSSDIQPRTSSSSNRMISSNIPTLAAIKALPKVLRSASSPLPRGASTSKEPATSVKVKGPSETNRLAPSRPSDTWIPPSQPIKIKEKCTISKRSVQMIKLAEQVLNEGITLLEMENQNPSSTIGLRPDLVLNAVCDIFDLHRSLMPVAHGDILRDVPSLAMQFYNDCEYVGKELDRLLESKRPMIDTLSSTSPASDQVGPCNKSVEKLAQQASLTRAVGQRWFESQMAAQTKVMLDTLAEADGFTRTFDDDRYAKCEKSVKQVVHVLDQLGKAWMPVLARSQFLSAMGRLVNTALGQVLHDVGQLEDIGETESEKIAGLIKMFSTMEELFIEPHTEQTSVALFVENWFKASYLIEVLTGSLVDIGFLAFEARALVDYTRQELIGLIKALFADTPKRARLIDKIESSGRDVLAG